MATCPQCKGDGEVSRAVTFDPDAGPAQCSLCGGTGKVREGEALGLPKALVHGSAVVEVESCSGLPERLRLGKVVAGLVDGDCAFTTIAIVGIYRCALGHRHAMTLTGYGRDDSCDLSGEMTDVVESMRRMADDLSRSYVEGRG